MNRLTMSMPRDILYTSEDTDEETISSLPFIFVFRAVQRSLNGQLIRSRLVAVKEEKLTFDSLSSYETLKSLIHGLVLNLGIDIHTRFREPYGEKVAIAAFDVFRANQARKKNTLGFIAVIHILEKYEEDEDTIMREITEASMEDIGPAMTPASKDSIEKLLSTRKIIEEEIDEACTVCLEDFLVGLDVKVMPCGHIFHEDCIIKWLQHSHFCPLCRYSMPIDDD